MSRLRSFWFSSHIARRTLVVQCRSALLACGAEPADVSCNGHLSLCTKRFDEVRVAMTHNAMSSSEEANETALANLLTSEKGSVKSLAAEAVKKGAVARRQVSP